MRVEPPGPWQPPGVAPGTTAYHYTSPEGLLGILADRALWATEANGLNDTSEVSEGRKLIHDYAQRELERNPNDTIMAMLAQVANQQLRTPVSTRVYVVSASLDPDDAGQWRLYGGKRAGYALHLDTDRPLHVVPEKPAVGELPAVAVDRSNVASVTAWSPVAYTDSEHQAVIRSLAEWARSVMPGYEELSMSKFTTGTIKDGLAQQALLEFGLDVLAASVDTASALVKPPGFRGEREVRAVALLDKSNDHVRLRANDHGIVQYVRVTCPDPPLGPIDSISPHLFDPSTGAPTRALPMVGLTVGPTPHFEQSLPALYAALRHAGLPEVHPMESNAPLRW